MTYQEVTDIPKVSKKQLSYVKSKMLDFYNLLQANCPQEFGISIIVLTIFRVGLIRECPQMGDGVCKKTPVS